MKPARTRQPARVTVEDALPEFDHNVTAMAGAFGVTRQAVQNWRSSDSGFIPEKHHVKMARLRRAKWGYLVRI